MRLTRTFTVVVVAFVLLIVTVPAAQARSFEGPQPAIHSLGGSWLGAAVTWLTRLAGVTPPPASFHSAAANSTALPPIGGVTGIGGGGIVPMTGSCIDPNGLPGHFIIGPNGVYCGH
ncbi:MAG TPA: hypothetical protein VIA62_29480 [Thermoanaerobaculia bacterium]|jgi:hypothetical protein|nr:hypothetical protein [Thermoanaerobaculia bacterium]